MSTTSQDRPLISGRNVIAAALALVLAFAASAVLSSSAFAWTSVSGTIEIQNGAGNPTSSGSYFRLQDPAPATSFHLNSSNRSTYTNLVGGTTGLTLGSTQTTAGDILDPQVFDGYPFDVYTTSGPTISYDETATPVSGYYPIRGNLTGWNVLWGGFYRFTQGADSVGGGIDHDLNGRYNPTTRLIEVNWTATVVDNYVPPTGFNDFRGHWHLVGEVV